MSPVHPGSKSLEKGPGHSPSGRETCLSQAPVSKILAREVGAHQAGCVRAPEPMAVQEHLTGRFQEG